jgi:hypothetical protein
MLNECATQSFAPKNSLSAPALLRPAASLMFGMFWTVRGANSIIALRCNRISGKFADYWESRAA